VELYYCLFNLFILICIAIALVVVEQTIDEYLGQLAPSRNLRQAFLQVIAVLCQFDGFYKDQTPSRNSRFFHWLRLTLAVFPWLLIPVTSQWRALLILFIFQLDFLLRMAEYLANSEKISFTLVKHQTYTNLISQCLYIPVLFIIALVGTSSNFFLRGIVAIVAIVAAIIHNNIGPFRAPTTLNEASAMPNSPIRNMLSVAFSVALFISALTGDGNIFQINMLKYSLFIAKISAVAVLSFVVFANIPSFRMNQCRRIFRCAIAPTAGGLLLFGFLARALGN
jgi:hypothetical protein